MPVWAFLRNVMPALAAFRLDSGPRDQSLINPLWPVGMECLVHSRSVEYSPFSAAESSWVPISCPIKPMESRLLAPAAFHLMLPDQRAIGWTASEAVVFPPHSVQSPAGAHRRQLSDRLATAQRRPKRRQAAVWTTLFIGSITRRGSDGSNRLTLSGAAIQQRTKDINVEDVVGCVSRGCPIAWCGNEKAQRGWAFWAGRLVGVFPHLHLVLHFSIEFGLRSSSPTDRCNLVLNHGHLIDGQLDTGLADGLSLSQ